LTAEVNKLLFPSKRCQISKYSARISPSVPEKDGLVGFVPIDGVALKAIECSRACEAAQNGQNIELSQPSPQLFSL
jgi:hypothetical protein